MGRRKSEVRLKGSAGLQFKLFLNAHLDYRSFNKNSERV